MNPANSRGFTLLEAMVAVVVLSIGLLGIAAVQALSLRYSTGSYGRTQATLAAYDIADRIRANKPAVASNSYLLNPASPPSNPGVGANCTTASCTVAQMAQTDLAVWLANLSAPTGYDLGGGTGRITCSANPCVAGSIITISVMWDDQRTGATSTLCPTDPSNSPVVAFDPAVHLTCFQMSMAI